MSILILSMSFRILCYNFSMFDIKLKELRLEKGITQYNLAKEIGCNQSMIVRWERGECEPPETYIKKVALYFDVSADYLLGIEDESGAKINTKYHIGTINNSGKINMK